jgi:hypothetical protein
MIETYEGGLNNTLSNVFFNNCLCYAFTSAGIQIAGGENIVITGGRYSSNATDAPTSGGIAITGAAANVTINGVDLTPHIPASGYGPQPYAISITAAVAGLYVRGCNMTLYTTAIPVYASGAGAEIQITDCAGYSVPQKHRREDRYELTRCA